MERGNVYLIGAARQDDTDALCREILSARAVDEKAIMFTVDREPAEALAGLPDDQGPGELRLYRVQPPAASPFSALQTLPRTIARRLSPGRGLLVLHFPVNLWEGVNDATLVRWLHACASMARKVSCALLIFASGPEVQAFLARMRPLNDNLSGLARLHREGGTVSYLIRHWRSRQGVMASRRFRLPSSPDGRYPTLIPCEFSRPQEEPDADVYLAVRGALESVSSRPFTTIFDDAKSLYLRALEARAATVVFSLEKSADIAEIAGYLHKLRQVCGGALKLVVREMTPCLRYRDEQNLLACGANLIVPHGTGNTRLLTQLASIQGQIYARPLAPDPIGLLARSYRPQQRGIFASDDFVRHLNETLDAPGADESQGVLVVLEPVRTLSAQQAIGQCQLRRYGDLACTHENQVFLYLFECHPDIAPYALQQVFRLPFRRLFRDWRIYGNQADIRHQIQPLRKAVAEPDGGPQTGSETGKREPARRPVRQPLLN